MTFGSFTANAVKYIILLPLILTRLETADIAIWYLFVTIIIIQNIADIGFSPTFSRVIAYAMAGASSDYLSDYRKIDSIKNSGMPNWETMEKICHAMHRVYLLLIFPLFILLLTLGTYSLIKPISHSHAPTSAWISWSIVVLTTTVKFYGNKYSAYLQGTNHIALLRRWEIISAIGAIVSGITVLSLGGRLLALVCSQQVWVLINMVRNRVLCGLVEEGRFNQFQSKVLDRNVVSAVWPSAWRSGIGIIMSQGLIQVSGLIYAQHGSSSSVASYLLGLRFVHAISQFSQAPFYSKLPILSKLRATGNISKQIRLASGSMRLSYWTYVICFIFVSATATPLLELIDSNADFPEPLLWTLLGIGIFAERFGAMHIQLYSTTNHIIWHIATGGSGILYLTTCFFLYSHISVYAFPIGIIIGYLGFYCWYSAWHSHRAFNLKFWEFENNTIFKPLLVMCLFVVSLLVWSS